MKKDTIWNFFLIVSILIMINGMTNMGDPDKKNAQAAADQTGLGALGAAAAFIGKKGFAITMPIVALILGGAFLTPLIAGNWADTIRDLFAPQPTIPSWVWIAGFGILLIMVLKKK